MLTNQGASEAEARLYARSWKIAHRGAVDDSVLRELLEVLVPALEGLDGYCGGSLLIDRTTGDLVGTTYWDSLEHLEAGQARSRNAAVGALVLTEGMAMEVSISEVLMISPAPRHLAPELRSDRDG